MVDPRPLVLLLAVVLALPVSHAGHDDPIFPSLTGGDHPENGWVSVAFETDAGFRLRITVRDADEHLGLGLAYYTPEGALGGASLVGSDALDTYYGGNGVWYTGRATEDGWTTTYEWRCGNCAGEWRAAMWVAGSTDWSHEVLAGPSARVLATDGGPEAWVLHNEDFGATQDPTGLMLGYATSGGRVTFPVQGTLVGGVPTQTLFWDDDIYGASVRQMTLTAPDATTRTCPGDCLWMAANGPGTGAGTYTLDAVGTGAGLAHMPLLFTGADVRLAHS